MSSNQYKWLNEPSRLFLERGYLKKGETVDGRIREIAARAFADNQERHDKFIHYMQEGYYSLASPIWSNFGRPGDASGISCFGSYFPDSREGLLSTNAEVGWMSTIGGGTSGYFGDVRHRGARVRKDEESDGSVHFMLNTESVVQSFKQSSVRRGSFAAYLPIEHDDFYEFIGIRDEGHAIQHLSYGITISDDFMRKVQTGDKEARKRFLKVLESRSKKGYPYIMFSDNANAGESTPEVYKDQGYIKSSNLCSEIMLPQNDDESFVCCLSSLNLAKFDEWENTDAPEILVYLLDAVLTEFIDKNKGVPFMQRAVRFAERHRAIGIGVFGWHDYLQSKMLPFTGFKSNALTHNIFALIRQKLVEASEAMAEEYGMPEMCQDLGRRHTTLMAIAPTTSSAFIIGQTSQSIEPLRSNFYTKDLAKLKFIVKNKHLERLLAEKGENTEETWRSILQQHGSVQHLECLTEEEKEVFKTFEEINQRDLVIQASIRQKYIDQGQSLNLIFHPNTPVEDLIDIHFTAWELGLKSLYYQHSKNAAQEFKRELTQCTSCEG